MFSGYREKSVEVEPARMQFGESGKEDWVGPVVRTASAIDFEMDLQHVPGRKDYLGLWACGRYDCW